VSLHYQTGWSNKQVEILKRLFTPATHKTSLVRTIFRVVLGISLIFAGIAHFTFQRMEYFAQVPGWVPLDADLVVVLSGIVEILLGLALVLLERYRVQAGWLAAIFFVLVFPGNISQYLNGNDAFGLDTDQARLMRLFFQPVLVLWALWSTGAWKDRPK
jgi:uncharacterized membrane protein